MEINWARKSVSITYFFWSPNQFYFTQKKLPAGQLCLCLRWWCVLETGEWTSPRAPEYNGPWGGGNKFPRHARCWEFCIGEGRHWRLWRCGRTGPRGTCCPSSPLDRSTPLPPRPSEYPVWCIFPRVSYDGICSISLLHPVERIFVDVPLFSCMQLDGYILGSKQNYLKHEPPHSYPPICSIGGGGGIFAFSRIKVLFSNPKKIFRRFAGTVDQYSQF